MAEGKYYEAEAFAKRAQEVDPDEVTAVIIAWKAKAEGRMKTNIDIRNAMENGVNTAFTEVDRSAIADPEVQLNGLKYARNFKDLTKERLAMNARLEPKKDPKTLAIEAKLNETITVNMDKQPLSEAINFLQNYTGLNIVVDQKALSDENVTSASPVDLHLNNISLKGVLKQMLRPLGLTYKVEDGVLLITNPQASLASTYSKPYYVGDLIMPPKADVGPLGLLPAVNPERATRPTPGDVQAQGRADEPRSGRGAARGRQRRRPAGLRRRAADGGHDALDPAHHDVDRAGELEGLRPGRAGGLRGLRHGRRLRRRRRRRRGRRHAADRLDHAVLPQHQPDHPPHGGDPRPDRRPAPAAPPAPGLAGVDRGPVHHPERQLLRADRRRLRLRDQVQGDRQA